MTAVLAWARAQLRKRWGTLVVVGIVAGLAAAATMAAVAGARRTATTYDRHLSTTHGAHAEVASYLAPVEDWHPDRRLVEPFLDTDDVADATVGVLLGLGPVSANLAIPLFDTPVIGALDDRLGTNVDRFRLIEGRVYDHAAPDEIVITEVYRELVGGVGVGDTVSFESWTKDTRDAFFSGSYPGAPPADGPMIEATVVGVVEEITPTLGQTEPGRAYASKAFTDRWADEVSTGPPIAFVRLVDGPAGFGDYEQFVEATNRRVGEQAIVQATHAGFAQVDGAIDAQVFALHVFALISGASALVVVLALLSRVLSFASYDQVTLTAIGAVRMQRVAAIGAVGMLSAVTASAVGVISSVLASRLLPIGTPGVVEPDPGVRADGMVLLAGGAAVFFLVTAAAVLTGISVTRPRPARAGGGETGSVLARLVRSSPSISVGVRLSVGGSRGPRALPARSTLAACVVGLTGSVASLGFSASLDHLPTDGDLWGWVGDVQTFAGSDRDFGQELVQQLAAEPTVEALYGVTVLSISVNDRPVDVYAYRPVRGEALFSLIEGHVPRASDEIVLGAGVADSLDVGTGDAVSVLLADGSTRRFTVSALAPLPGSSDTFRDEGALLDDTLDELAALDGQYFYGASWTVRDGFDIDEIIAGLEKDGFLSFTATPPRAIAFLDEVHLFPRVLAAVLVGLAATAVALALTTAVRRRRSELGVLKALGFSRRQMRTIPAAQAVTMSVLGLVIAVPLGIGIGRTAWATVAAGMGVVTKHALPTLLIGFPIAWLVGAALLSLPTGQWIVSSRAADDLRSEGRE